MRLRQLMVVVLISGALVGMLPNAAAACSCAGLGPEEMLAGHDAAFVGRLVSRRGGLLAGDATWGFEVTREVKGDFAPTVKISSPSSGASCGFELDEGQEAAIFVRVEGTQLHSGLCSTLDADAMRAFLNPQRVVKTRATLLVAAGGSDPHLWLFDDDGRLAGATGDAGRGWLEDVAVCPGGRTVVELWEGEVVVRDLGTLRAVRTHAVPGDVGRVWCDDAAGHRIMAARRNHSTGDWASIVSLRAPRRAVVSGDWIDVELIGDHLVTTVGRENTQLRRISLASGREALMYRALGQPRVDTDIPASIEGLAVSPDGTRVAFEVTTYPADGAPSSDVFIYDVRTGRRLATRHIPAEGMQVRWLDDSAVVFTSYEQGTQLLAAADLQTLARFGRGVEWVSLRGSGGTVLGMDGPRLAALDIDTGRARTLAAVPAEHSSWLLRLPLPIRINGPKQQRPPRPPAAPTGAQLSGPAYTSSDALSLLPSAPAASVAAMLLVGVFLLWAKRRRP